MTEHTERALADLRHLYTQMVNGAVQDSEQAKRIAKGLLSPAIARLEQAAEQPETERAKYVADGARAEAQATMCGAARALRLHDFPR